MFPNFTALLETIQVTVGGWIGFLARPSTFVQFGILVAIFGISTLLSRKIEPPLEVKAGKLKINPDTKRMLFADTVVPGPAVHKPKVMAIMLAVDFVIFSLIGLNDTTSFFDNPQHECTKDLLGQILQH